MNARNARRILLGIPRVCLTCFFAFVYTLFGIFLWAFPVDSGIPNQDTLDSLAQKRIQQEYICLSHNTYHEARGESTKGQRAVEQVVLNRVQSKKYPNTICGVVLQKHQFSWTSDKRKVQAVFNGGYGAINERLTALDQKDSLSYQQDVIVADRGLNGGLSGVELQGVLHYARWDVRVQWMEGMTAVQSIGNHVFYR